MNTSKDDYLINTLRFVSAKEESQIYGARLPKSMTSPEMRETKAYKTYLGYATGVTPPKKAHKFKKHASPKLSTVLASPVEPTWKSKRVKRPIKKSSDALIAGVVIRESPVNEKGSDSEHETNENESGSEFDQEENEEENEDDEEEEDDEFVKTLSNDTHDEDETKIKDKVEVDTDEGFIQKEGTDTEMINKTEVLVTSTSHSSDLASKFLNFLDIPHTDAEIVSPMDVHVHHEVPSNQTPTLLTIHVSVITDSSPVYSTVIPQSLPSFTPPPQQSTLTPPPTTKATKPLSALLNFASVFQFNNRVTALEKEVDELKKDDPLNTQVTALVDEYLDPRLGATRDEYELPILPKEVSNFSPLMIKSMVTESLEHAVLAKESSQPKLTYEAAALLTKFELKKILIDKMDESQSYLTATEHRECYDRLIKSYDLDKSLFSTYDKVFSLKRSQKDKDKDEDPSAGSDRGLKKRKTSKDAEPTKGPGIKTDIMDPVMQCTTLPNH
ncbi:hypothetical protein Tco_1377714 [Tanacetum coccineum]